MPSAITLDCRNFIIKSAVSKLFTTSLVELMRAYAGIRDENCILQNECYKDFLTHTRFFSELDKEFTCKGVIPLHPNLIKRDQEFRKKCDQYFQDKDRIQSWITHRMEYCDLENGNFLETVHNVLPEILINYMGNLEDLPPRTKEFNFLMEFNPVQAERNYKRFIEPKLQYYIGVNLLGI